MTEEDSQDLPYWLRLPPRFNLGPLLNRCAVWLYGIVLLSLSVVPSFILIYLLAPMPEWVAMLIGAVGLLSMIGLVWLDERRSSQSPYWQNAPFTKWCYIPPTVNAQNDATRAWVRSKTHFKTIHKPGFYFLRSGYHVEFVGTPDEMTDFTCRRLNGEL